VRKPLAIVSGVIVGDEGAEIQQAGVADESRNDNTVLLNAYELLHGVSFSVVFDVSGNERSPRLVVVGRPLISQRPSHMFCESRLLSLVDRLAAFCLCFPAFQKVLGVEEGSKLLIEL
jgi:hypothetical protein